jgi:hypothetical protein
MLLPVPQSSYLDSRSQNYSFPSDHLLQPSFLPCLANSIAATSFFATISNKRTSSSFSSYLVPNQSKTTTPPKSLHFYISLHIGRRYFLGPLNRKFKILRENQIHLKEEAGPFDPWACHIRNFVSHFDIPGIELVMAIKQVLKLVLDLKRSC